MRRAWIFAGMITVGMMGARSAQAQDAQTGVSATATASGSTQAVTTTTSVAPTPNGTAVTTTTAASDNDTTPDHELVIRRFAVGYMGVSQVPISTGSANNGRDNVNAPVIGARYWLTRTLGIDAGLGLGLTTGSTETVTNNASVSTDNPSRFGFVLHGGVPLALVHGKHYSFEVVPETNIGFASGTIKTVNPANTPDQDLSGFRFDLGARAGAEIYFGFIGIPQLSLQASVGLYFRREVYKWKQGANSASVGTTSFSTSVQADPWALFVNNISAFYYF